MIETSLSIILITKNQAWNIARLLNSVMAELPNLPRTEVILVDSMSSDETVNIALRYPGVKVLRLSGARLLTPAAGRYAGFHYSEGEWILHMDGDTELVPGWIGEALETLKANQNLAGITGQLWRIYEGQTVELPSAPQRNQSFDICSFVHGGLSMYRRSVLDKVGTFNPWIYSEEEAELAIRIRGGGFQLARNAQICAIHRDLIIPQTFAGAFARYRRKLLIGQGQILRKYLFRPGFWIFLSERGKLLGPAIILNLATILAVLLSVVTVNWLWLERFGIALLLSVLTLALWKRSLYQAVRSIFAYELLFIGTLQGIFFATPPASNYRIDNIEVLFGREGFTDVSPVAASPSSFVAEG